MYFIMTAPFLNPQFLAQVIEFNLNLKPGTYHSVWVVSWGVGMKLDLCTIHLLCLFVMLHAYCNMGRNVGANWLLPDKAKIHVLKLTLCWIVCVQRMKMWLILVPVYVENVAHLGIKVLAQWISSLISYLKIPKFYIRRKPEKQFS